MNNKGFTLIEVLAVIAIIAIVGIIATPGVLSMISTSKDSSYNALVNSIKTAAIELYQEKDYMDTDIYKYDNSGRTLETIDIDIISNSITVNLQTLVGNGFLIGTNNSGGINKNNKVIVEPKNNNDIGECKIKIVKVLKSNNVCYKIDVVSGNASYCPKFNDFGGANQC